MLLSRRVGKVKRFPPQNRAKLEIGAFKVGFGIVPHLHSYAILAYCNDCSFPELGKVGIVGGERLKI